jgi:uncharacterized protein (DUF2252 family)
MMATMKLRTPAQRLQAGRSLRDKVPRAAHGEVVLGQGNKRDVVALVKDSNKDRLANLVPIRHGRMLQSPFAFFRGTAGVQAHDLAGTPASGIHVQACGDCHLVNFGGFATPERSLVFDLNDFDETLRAPFEWDLKRLAASFVVAARWRGFRAREARDAAVEAVSAYRQSMRKRAESGVLESWYSRMAAEDLLVLAGKDAEFRGRIKRRIADSRGRTSESVFHKITAPTRGLPRIVDQPPLLYHVDRKIVNARVIAAFLKRYRDTLPEERRFLFDRFQPVDVALKVVGVGSVGTRCYVALLLAAPEDALFLQVKEARPSVLERYTRQRVVHNGQRVVIGQRLMQSASDIFLGWSRGPAGRDFYVRQLRDMKVSPDVETMSPRVLRLYAAVCGTALARAHDKAGDAAMIAGYLGGSDKFDQAMGDYAVAYADQVERDYATFAAAARSGRVKTDLSLGELESVLR